MKRKKNARQEKGGGWGGKEVGKGRKMRRKRKTDDRRVKLRCDEEEPRRRGKR